MCCFSQPVISVSNTQIFARGGDVGWQYLVYQMNYESADANAMILPLPIKQPATEQSLEFIDLSDCDTFFDDLDHGFPYHTQATIGCAAPRNQLLRLGLEVHKVGNYIASFVPTLGDFDRLDPKFVLPRQVWKNFPGYEDYGFAVFQLAAGSLKPHPMAFQFKTDGDALFFPTLHIHDGMVHSAEEFDHVLYMQHAGLDSRVYRYENADIEDRSTGLIRSKYKASRFCKIAACHGVMDGDLLVHRKIMRGEFPNVDTVFELSGNPTTPTLNLRPWLGYTPWLMALGAVAWFLNRRSRLKIAARRR
ncbi:MAG: hypothetical protein U0905_13610 [Pirellulales bacterium]